MSWQVVCQPWLHLVSDLWFSRVHASPVALAVQLYGSDESGGTACVHLVSVHRERCWNCSCMRQAIWSCYPNSGPLVVESVMTELAGEACAIPSMHYLRLSMFMDCGEANHETST